MARFEVTITTGEKIVVVHAAAGMPEFFAEIDGRDLLLLREITGAAAGAERDVIISSAQLTMVRPLSDLSTQGSNFRPKR